MRIGGYRDVDELPIHGDYVGYGIGTRAELTYNPAVDCDPSLEDHVLGRTQCRDTGARKYFVETVQHAGITLLEL
jgi:hypothetical protein